VPPAGHGQGATAARGAGRRYPRAAMGGTSAEQGYPAGLLEQAGALGAGALGSVELVNAALTAIERSQPTLNAFRVVRAEAALAEAAAADRRLAAGERAPLLGVPVAVKDDTDVAGESTNFGCRGDFPACGDDAELVRRLREAGAVIVGKTTTPEFGQWPITEGEACGPTRNPWSLEHTPGGSSGGSAAAVAAGLLGGAVGSDGAGSVRIPASWTNLVGVKPQRGRVSTWPHPEPFNGLTCNGPLTRTVADAALLLEALTGNHPAEPHRPPRPREPFTEAVERSPGRLRVAFSLQPPFSGAPARLDLRVRERVEATAATLERLGHSISPAEPGYGLIGLSFVPRASAGVAEWEARVPDPELLDYRTRGGARTGRLLGGPILRAARTAERRFRSRVGRIFDRFDVVLAPTTAKPPPPIGAIDGLSEWQTDRVVVGHCPYAWPWNVLGWPAISVPAGLVDGLPVGAQLLGPEGSEPLLLALAAELEDELRWHERRPSLQ
jgi:amidase